MPAVRTPASSSDSNTVGVSADRCSRVHVVDRVGQRALEAERLRGLEARAVLDVALLVAVVPVHRRDLVAVRAGPGGDRGGADRRDRRERRDALARVVPALHQQLQRRRAARRDRLLQHGGLHRVDDGEDELLGPRHGVSAGSAVRRTSRPRGGGRPRAARPARRRRAARAAGRGSRRPRRGARRLPRRRAARAAACSSRRRRTRPNSCRAAWKPERGRGDAGDRAGPPVARAVRDGARGDQRTQRRARARGARRAAAGGRRRRGPRGGRRSRAPSTRTRTPSRKGHSSRKAKSVPSKSRPRFAAASAPASRTGRNGRMPIAAASPTPWRRSRRKSMVS